MRELLVQGLHVQTQEESLPSNWRAYVIQLKLGRVRSPEDFFYRRSRDPTSAAARNSPSARRGGWHDVKIGTEIRLERF